MNYNQRHKKHDQVIKKGMSKVSKMWLKIRKTYPLV